MNEVFGDKKPSPYGPKGKNYKFYQLSIINNTGFYEKGSRVNFRCANSIRKHKSFCLFYLF